MAPELVVFLLVSCAAGVWTAPSRDSLYIGAFNMKTFGQTKMSHPEVAERIRKIVDRYDILHAEEIRDKSEESIYQLLGMLNNGPEGSVYNVSISDPIGRTTYKEQYAYFYRIDRVVIHESHTYADSRDIFEREPYSVLASPISDSSDRFALIGLHAKPTDAVAEIGALRDVINDVRSRWSNAKIVVLGDLNADCSYATRTKREEANDYLTTSGNYNWLIGEDADTTVRDSTDCAYDRFVVENSLSARVVSGSAIPFNFGAWLHLDEAESLDVSDHYPVEVKFRL